MEITQSETIRNLSVVKPRIFHDLRGEYVETFNVDTYKFVDDKGQRVVFREDDISVSRQHVLRGLHGDAVTWKLIQCLLGEIYVVVVDQRRDSSTFGKWEGFYLNERNRWQIVVPAGCANGHLCLSEKCIFSYKQSHIYRGPEEQFTLRWDDPKLGIWWPIRSPLLSERDSNAPLLS